METISGSLEKEEIICPVCGTQNWKTGGQVKDYSITGEWFELKECMACGLKATFPQPEAEKLGRYYASSNYISHSDSRSGMINKLFHRARTFMLTQKLKWVNQASGLQAGTLLDVGAGTGHFARYMQDHGWKVAALEPDESARRVGKDKLGIEISPMESITTLDASTFDVITLWHVLEHVQDLNGYLAHFKTLLRPGGTLLIAVPNFTSDDAKHYKSKWAAYDVPRHLWHFSPLSMEMLLSKNGFSLKQKISMPLDAFYVSMLSERYRGNNFLGPATAFYFGLKSFLAGRKSVDKGSSIIYVSK